MLRLASFALALVFAVPAAATPGVQDRPIRTGTWDLAIVFGGGNLEATLDIGYRGDTITASLKLGDHDSPVRAGKQTGTKLTLEPTSPSMDVRYELEFNADEVKGTFTYQGEAGQLTGKRRRTGR
jgi:hypothetical protein